MALLLRGCYGIIHILNYNQTFISMHHVKTILYKKNVNTVPCLWKSTASRKSAQDQKTNQQVSFEKMVESRRMEASRSILVQVHSEQSCADLHEYCSQYGEVKGMHHYSLTESMHFVLVEFVHKTDVDHILDASRHINTNEVVPVRSPFLWFRAHKKVSQSKQPTAQTLALAATNGNCMPSQNDLKKCLQTAESLSDQIQILQRMTSLSDLGSRLRFLTARQMELALSGLFPQVTALPFGSSVNGFGKLACDLDLVLLTDKEEQVMSEKSDTRLMFQAKTLLANERSQVQRYMEMLADMCQMLLPGCSQVRRILQARVPIIKYHNDLTGVECDLSMTNMTAVHMSELLYILGASDSRVRPLVFAVRSWAREVGLTNPAPGRWITNFSLTLLVLFYLQQQSKTQAPVLPTLNSLISLAGPEDRRITPDGANCTFIRDINKLKEHMVSSTKKSSNTDNLETLFSGFFEFYAGFDFATHAVSLISGTAIPKPDHSPLYIVNPLERGLNVSKNLSHDETERLRVELRNAAWLLESVPLLPDTQSWGLNALFEAPQTGAKGRNIFYIPTKRAMPTRIVDVSDLFQEDGSDNKATKSEIKQAKQTNEVQKAVKASGRRRR